MTQTFCESVVVHSAVLQAVLSQVAMLSEVQELIKQADVPEELWVEVSRVPQCAL